MKQHTFPILVLLFLSTIPAIHSQRLALSCSDHPAYSPSWTPPLLRSFTLLRRPVMFDRVVYHPRFTDADYNPVADPSSTRFHGLDLFFSGGVRAADELAEFHLHRPAKVFIFLGTSRVFARARFDRVVSLRGWESEGWAQLPGGARNTEFGIHQKGEIALQEYVYIFSKNSDGLSAMVPSVKWVNRNLNVPFKNVGGFHVRVSEQDGSQSPPTGMFGGKEIPPNTQCPDELHDAWAVADANTRDPDTTGQLFSSWHPAWDPCFRCAYDHEHGSSPQHLMGYVPRYTYTAFKNGRQKEEDSGFKGFVWPQGNFMVYYGMHAQASSLRRINERFHTIVVAITDAKTKELMYEFSQKGDFGFRAGRGRRGGFVPFEKEDEEIMDEQNSDKEVHRRFRSFNVIDMKKFDQRFEYRRRPLEGVYEAWVTLPKCVSAPPFGQIIVDLKSPGSGVKGTDRVNEMVELSRSTRNVGAARSIRVDAPITFSGAHCKFSNSDAEVSGYFYTDTKGETLLDGPGPNAVRQYAKKGFSLDVTGVFEVEELGLGLHEHRKLGFFYDHGYGLNPDKN